MSHSHPHGHGHGHDHDHDHDHDHPPHEVVDILGDVTRLEVPGLCCDAEVALVHRRLDDLPGVRKVSVDLVGRRVAVDHDDGQAPVHHLIAQLAAAGLDAEVAHTPRLQVQPTAVSPELAASGGFFLVSLLTPILPGAHWVALGAVLVGLPPIARKAWLAAINRVLDMNALMTIAVVGAIGIGEWIEAAAVVFLFGLSEWLEERSLDRARAAMTEVIDLVPETATLPGGAQVPVETVTVGTIVAVKPGERVPLDGVVTEGRSAIDESALSGESMPVDKTVGDEVSAGTVNTSGYLEVRATAPVGDSAVARLVRLVEEARSARSPSERFVDQFARIYTPAVVVGALALAVVPPLLWGAAWSVWVYRALVLLVVACPCALVISTPVAVVSGLARAARRGVLIKGGVHLETLGRVRSLALDKTGTLTEGRFRVVDCFPMNGFTDEELHELVAAAEAGSSHPLAEALLDHVGTEAASGPRVYETIEGEGVHVRVGDRVIDVGNHRMAERLGWHDPEEHRLLDAWMQEGRTVVYVGVNGKLAGLHSLADTPRAEARDAVARLHALGVKLVMLTGDNAGTADAVRRAVGLDEAQAELLPEDKVAAVKRMAALGPVAMVGDGINDAPALAAADVGIAMGVRGTAVAMETADVALLTDDLRHLAEVIDLGRRSRAVIQRNIAFSIAVKAAVLALAVMGVATLWMAVAADVGATLLVVLYSMTLLRA